ncbi:HD domain-containing phosphohydrolase [Fontimonas sp. SYSU GA230001]|uniref:HD domain-containing phosphohydrolase n=1 Tax=Fontimonas sp. SYSU GA230001 TaxID=3142450 RepID=UPI0032B58194
MNLRDELALIEDASAARPTLPPWKILIADDDEDVHKVTRLALEGLAFDDRPLAFLDAYSGAETVRLLAQHPDTAIALVDVVMDTESDGLDAIEAIRSQLRNRYVRIVLRTGQPGQAPERDVVSRYDINDYKEKSELTATRLFTLIYTGLSQYRDLMALASGRAGLQTVIASSASVFEQRTPAALAATVLREFASLLSLDIGPQTTDSGGIALGGDPDDEYEILCGVGRFENAAGGRLEQFLGPHLRAALQHLGAPPSAWRMEHDWFCAVLPARGGVRWRFLLAGAGLVAPSHQLLDLFCANVRIALESVRLNQEVDRTQSELVFMLSEAIEKRSLESGNHVRRVAAYAQLLARLAGLPEEETEILRLASPLHDAGKIAIPDAILNKPGRHTPEESQIMKGHAQIGADMFGKQTLPVLKAAAIVAAQHHERWDGLGYPNRLRGEDIHIYGRITALADVFDALGSDRCYKSAWPLEQVLDLLRAERGRHFDPGLVDAFFDNLPAFLEIRTRLADP